VSRVECTGKEERLQQRIVYALPNLSGDADTDVSSEAARIQALRPGGEALSCREPRGSLEAMRKPQDVRNKVVIIGASNAARRDQHQTPIGSMPGALLVAQCDPEFRDVPGTRGAHILEKKRR
jgi:hypothetical protein